MSPAPAATTASGTGRRSSSMPASLASVELPSRERIRFRTPMEKKEEIPNRVNPQASPRRRPPTRPTHPVGRLPPARAPPPVVPPAQVLNWKSCSSTLLTASAARDTALMPQSRLCLHGCFRQITCFIGLSVFSDDGMVIHSALPDSESQNPCLRETPVS